MGFAAALLLAAQVVFTPTPVPAPPAAVGSEVFAQEKLRYEGELREACLSEAGVRIVIENWERKRSEARAKPGDWERLEDDVGQAAFTQPFDLARMEQAVRARAEGQNAATTARAEDDIAVLRLLSPQDRAIHARRMTFRRTAMMPKVCPRAR